MMPKEYLPIQKGNVYLARCKRRCGFEIVWHMPSGMSQQRCDRCGGELEFAPTTKYYRLPLPREVLEV